MWLTNKLQWAPSSGQLSASSPPLPTKLLSHDPRGRGCSVQLEAVEPDPLANTGNHSLLIPHSYPQPGPSSQLSGWPPNFQVFSLLHSPSLLQLPDPPSLCIASHWYKETLLVKEPSRVDQGERDSGSYHQDCLWNPQIDFRRLQKLQHPVQ